MNQSWQQFIDSLALDNTAEPLLDNAIYPLTSQGFLDINGIDAGKFLQGQLSCDVQQISLQHSGLGSHSNAKGRMQSSFRICRYSDNGFLLRTHSSILQHAHTTLAKYIVFSKATIAISEHWVGIGLHGDNAHHALSAHFSLVPRQDYQQHIEHDCVLICTSADKQSYEVYSPPERAISLWKSLATIMDAKTCSQHQLLENHLGLAFVEAGTCDRFTPQMFNYQATPAISFKKGCYTGQEIVARMHYLGKIKRHMRHFTAAYSAQIKAGDSVFADSMEQTIGDIVSAVPTGKNHWDLLINLTDEAAKTVNLQLSAGILQQPIEVKLPYALVD